MKKFGFQFLVAALVALSFAGTAKADEETSSGGDSLASREGFIFHVDAMVDVIQSLGTTSQMPIGFMPQASAQYFLTNRFGFGLSVSYVTRSFKTGSLYSSADFIDVTLGVVGRRVGDLFSDHSVLFYEIGPFLAMPLGDFTGPLTLGFSNRSKPYYGLSVVSGTIYPVTDTFGLGPAATVRMAFADPVQNSTGTVWFWDICLGLRATF